MGARIGEGYFGAIHEGVLALPSRPKITVIIKLLGEKAGEKEQQAFMNEIAKMAQAHHDNVVEMYGACTHASPLLLVTEHCSEGSFAELLKAEDPRLNDRASSMWEKHELGCSILYCW